MSGSANYEIWNQKTRQNTKHKKPTTQNLVLHTLVFKANQSSLILQGAKANLAANDQIKFIIVKQYIIAEEAKKLVHDQTAPVGAV